MAVNAVIRVDGLKPLIRDLTKLSRELGREVRHELKEVAVPVAEDARQRAVRYGSRTSSGIRPRVRGAIAVVEQSARKVTGKRGDFGALQMRKVLLPALVENQGLIEKRMDDMLGRLAGEFERGG